MTRQAVVLVGGRGTRLGHLTAEVPKPLMPVAGRPFLAHLLLQLTAHDFRDIVLLAGYRADRIRAALGDGAALGARLTHRVEDRPLGTGGALAAAADVLAPDFLLVNGDTLFDFDLADFTARITPEPWLVRMALRAVPDTARYGAVEYSEVGVTRFVEKSESGGHGVINAGYYWMRRDAIAIIPPAPASLERDVLPQLVARGLVQGITFPGAFIDIGTPQDLGRAETIVRRFAGAATPGHEVSPRTTPGA